MPDSTNVPGAVCISGGPGLRATLRPEWRPLLDQVRKDLNIAATEVLRRATAVYPQANMAEALRLFIAAHLAGTHAGAQDSDKVVELNCVTRHDIPPDRILRSAIGHLESAVLVGYTAEGEEFFASSVADGAQAIWLLQRGAHKLLSMPETHS